MNFAKRREFLKLCAISVPALAFAHDLVADNISGSGKGQPTFRKPGALERYLDPLPVPKQLMPQSTHAGGAQYRISMLEFTRQMHSQLPPTRLWGYEGQYPGPTIEALRNRPIQIAWENLLPSTHLFNIDPHIHGEIAAAAAIRTVPHLHGGHTRSKSDGLPEKWFTAGNAALYEYANCQQAATLWYHDQALGIARLNVYAGLLGFYLLRDDDERGMNLPSGDYEVPLLIQDRTLDDKGQLVYSPTFDDGQRPPSGLWAPELFGELPVVNGAIYPYLQVEPRRYRLRLLNGANSRFFNLFFNLAKSPTDVPLLVPFHQIGSDGGLLPAPVQLNKVLLSPAERADLIVDFSKLDGKAVTLSNDAPAPFPGWGSVTPHHAALNEVMQFRVTLPLASNGGAAILPTLHSFSRLDEEKSVCTRDFLLGNGMDRRGRFLGMQINGKGYEDPVTERVALGSTETWRFINNTQDAHPMHLHRVQFQVVQRQGFDPASVRAGALRLVGTPRRPPENEAGWKDTAVVNAQEVLTILVRFDGDAGSCVLNSCILEHQDHDMMRPFEVVSDPLKS